MGKLQYEIKKHIDITIKVGDIVKIFDGSGLTYMDNKTDVYIIFAYPFFTGSNIILKELPFIVTKVGITTLASSGIPGMLYIQDIEIQHGPAIFYTCSMFVNKL